MQKKTAIYLSLFLCIPVLYLLYLDISSGITGLGILKLPLLYIILVCQLLREAFSKKESFDLPAEIKEHEDYILAKDRMNYGRNMGISGGLMIIIPVVLLFVLKSLHGFWARAAIFSFLFGIPVAIIGLILFMMGKHYIAQAEAKQLAETSTEPESKLSNICNIISAITSLMLLIVIIID